MTKKKVVRIFDWKSNTFFPKRAQKCKNFNILSEKLDIFARGPDFGHQTPGPASAVYAPGIKVYSISPTITHVEIMFLKLWATPVNKEQRVNFSENYYMYFGLIALRFNILNKFKA